MSNKLLNSLSTIVEKFREKAIDEIQPGIRLIESPLNDKDIVVTESKVNHALGIICSRNHEKLKDDYINHFDELRRLLPLCSSPSSFRTAWDLRSAVLNNYDAENIIQQGGQLIPTNKLSRIFQCIQQGVELGPSKRLILGIRHSEGNYQDKLDDLGRFTYQPPRDTTGMLRYRYCQYLAESLKIDFIILVMMWFEYRINENLNQLFIIAPSRIIEFDNDLNDLNKSLHHPLKLQLINRSKALSSINKIFVLNESNLELKYRFDLSDTLAREWSYDKLNRTIKGRKIKKWAQESGKKCPGCKKEFKDFPQSKLSFGHVISQNWGKSFTYLLEKIDHPDNLYLTCNSCNSSLSDKFPEGTLRENIINENTIGDWLRKNETDIRNI